MKKPALAVALAIATAFAVAASGSAMPPNPPKNFAGHVYVNDNTAGTNTVAGFDRNPDGSLTPMPGFPFAVGGAGLGKGNASQGSLQLSSDGRYLLAVDAGSNQISILRIKPDGSLDQVEGSPVSSGGVNPVSIAVSRDLVYVANQGPGSNPDDTNYTGFRLDPGGHLRPIPGSTYALPSNATPGQVLFNRDGSGLVGTEIGTSAIDSFTVGRGGVLTPAPGSPFDAQSFTPPQGFGQLGSVFSPVNPDQLFVSDAHTAAGGPAPGLVSSLTDDPSGVLTPLAPSPVANDGTASCWVEITADGAFLFVVNTASHTVSTYSIAANGSISFLQSTPASDLGGGAEDARLSPDGSTLWVVQAGADAVTGFSVSGGSLTFLTQASGPAGATPTGIVVT
jgi:6-phosphogluconolactonase (cycloisomerase 2 family)